MLIGVSDNKIQVTTAPETPYLQVFTGLGVGSTEVETRLPLRDKVYPAMPLLCVRYDSRFDGGGPELTLLRTTPPIRVGQHEFDIV